MKVYIIHAYELSRDSYEFNCVFDSEQKAKDYCDKHNPKPIHSSGPDFYYEEVELE